MSQILAYGKLFSQHDYEKNPVKFSALLSNAKTEQGYALCKCTTPAPKLVIRSKTGAYGTRHYLATWPNDGTAHASHCNFFVPDDEYKEANTKRIETVQEDKNGYHIKAGFPLNKLLNHLWQYAGLNTNDEKSSKTWGAIVSRLNEATTRGDIGGTPMEQILYVIPPFHKNRKDHIVLQWSNFSERFNNTPASKHISPLKSPKPFLLLGEIKATERLEDAIVTRLRHHAVPLYMSHQLADEITKEYPAETAPLNALDQPNRVLGLFQIEITERNNLWVNNAALTLVTDNYSCHVAHQRYAQRQPPRPLL